MISQLWIEIIIKIIVIETLWWEGAVMMKVFLILFELP